MKSYAIIRPLFSLFLLFGLAATMAASEKKGTSEGTIKLSTGVMYHNALASNNFSATLELERFISAHYGLVIGFNAGVLSDEPEARSYHGYTGINLHFFSESIFDLFIGGRGGFTNIFRGKERTINPTINVFLGSSFYFGRISLDAEIGYAVFGRASGEVYRDHSSLRGATRVGYLW